MPAFAWGVCAMRTLQDSLGGVWGEAPNSENPSGAKFRPRLPANEHQKIIFILSSIFSSMGFGIMETSEMKYDLSSVSICEKFAADGLGNLETAFSRCMFAGEPAKFIFDVMAAPY
jgi:hypothetical protein